MGLFVHKYLVVDNHMHSAMCGVGGQITQMKGFIDNALTCECSITMEQNGHHLIQKHSSWFESVYIIQKKSEP